MGRCGVCTLGQLAGVWCASVCSPVCSAVWAYSSAPLPTPPQVDTLLDSLISTFGEVEVAHKKPGSINPWQPVYRRYMEVLKKCILQIYHD